MNLSWPTGQSVNFEIKGDVDDIPKSSNGLNLGSLAMISEINISRVARHLRITLRDLDL